MVIYMSLDGIVTRNIVYDLKNEIINGRIDKIYQNDNFELLINIRNNGKNNRLLISASANQPRLYLTNNKDFNNPVNPPPFCMLLRKHLEGGKILNISQFKMDRIIDIEISSKDELGIDKSKSLIIELMGKYSNIILIENDNNRIIDAIKRINFTMSSVREILPGITYNVKDISLGLDPINNKDYILNIKSYSTENGSSSVKNALMKIYTGISPKLCNELEFISGIEFSRTINSLTEDELETINEILTKIMIKVENNNFSPIIVVEDGSYKDFYSLDLYSIAKQNKIYFGLISDVIEEYSAKKLVLNTINSKSVNLKKIVKKEIKRIRKKISKQSDELNEAINREKYKVYADLISSNYHLIEKGMKNIKLENFYDDMNIITVPLDDKLDAHQNAAHFYKKYSKLKSASLFLEEQIDEGTAEIDYLESILLNLNLAQNIQDVEEIRDELILAGYIKKRNKKNNDKVKSKKDNILKFTTDDGFIIYVGKNNKQNDFITFKIANKKDLWFHVKDAPGSHVILKNNGNIFTNDSMLMAAKLAAKYSSLSSSNNIPIDYTFKINVKRHPSGKLGLVNYINYKTININKKDNFS